MTQNRSPIIPTSIIPNVKPNDLTPRQVASQFRELLEAGYALKADGQARKDPSGLLRKGYTPKFEIELFNCRYFLCNKRDADGLKVVPAYVLPAGTRSIHARIFYKDSSLVWRSASHYVNTPEEDWIGKGAIKTVLVNGEPHRFSAEETTDLPFELQAALDEVSRRGGRSTNDNLILSLVLRNAPNGRVRPYRDFEIPREKAMSIAANRINDNRPVASFADQANPDSLQFEPGFEPDFSQIIDCSPSRSSMYGGDIKKYRIASQNGRIQYLFVAGPLHVWIVHPQSFTTALSSYGLRTVDVIADEELSIPGYEFADNAGDGETADQIPTGFAGQPCPYDEDRADASPWNDRLAPIKAFRQARL